MSSGIYRILNRNNGKFYVGSAVSLRQRWSVHKTALRAETHHNRHLQRSWNKHGPESFVFEVLERCQIDLLIGREQHWLDKLRPFGDIGYNICERADSPLGVIRSEETRKKLAVLNARPRKWTQKSRQKISDAHKGRNVTWGDKIGQALKGRKFTSETIEKMRKAQTGKKLSESTKCKISQAGKGRKVSAAAREKMRQAALRRYR